MTFEITNKDISKEFSVHDAEGNITDDYKVIITLSLKCSNEIVPVFSKDIEVVHSNSQTGFEVDEQREHEIQNFLQSINQ